MPINSHSLFLKIAVVAVASSSVVTTPSLVSASQAAPRSENRVGASADRDTPNALSAHMSTKGATEIVHGRSVKVSASLLNGTRTGVVNAGMTISLPRGITAQVRSTSWRCEGGNTAEMTCRLNRTLKSAERSRFTATLTAIDGAPTGRKEIAVAPFADGKPVTSGETFHLTVLDDGHPIMVPEVSHLTKNVNAKGVEVSVPTAHVGEDFTFAVTVRNTGHDRLTQGQRVRARQSVGDGVKIVKVTPKKSTSGCTATKKKWSCALAASRDIAPGGAVDTVLVTVEATKQAHPMALGKILVTTPGTKKTRHVTPRFAAEHGEDDVEIHAKSLHTTHEGGISTTRIVLENMTDSAVGSGHKVSIMLPRGFTYESGRGKNWTCAAPRAKTPTRMSCTYGARLDAGKKSSGLRFVTNVGAMHTASTTPDQIVFFSSLGQTTHNVHVLEAPKVEATGEIVRFTDGTYAVDLVGVDQKAHGHDHDDVWLQRCTTAEDATSSVCPGNTVAPTLRLRDLGHQRVGATLPKGGENRTWVFEFRAFNDSVSVGRIVTVRRAAASSQSVSPDPTPGVLNPGIATALSPLGVSLTGQPSTVGSTVTQTAQLTGNVAAQLSMFGTVGTVSDSGSCAQMLLDTTQAVPLGKDVRVTDFYIVAPMRNYAAPCLHAGTMVNKGMAFFTLDVFGQKFTFREALDPNAFAGNFNFVTTVASMNYPLANTNVTFKNVTLTFRIDLTLKTAGLLLAVNFDALGTTLFFGGLLTVDAKTQVLTGDLVMGVAQDITVEGVTLSDLMIGMGISYSRGAAPTSMNVTGSGKIEFLDQTIDIRDFSIDFDGDVVTAVRFDFAMNNQVQGAYTLNGDFTFQWRAGVAATRRNPNPQPPLQITATVQFNADGFQIGTADDPAMLIWTQNCLFVRGGVNVPGIFSADVMGLMVTQTGICSETSKAYSDEGMFAMIPRPSLAGDFRFDAQNVQFNIPGFNAHGNFSFGEVLTLPFGKIDMTTELSTSEVDADVYVAGDFSPLTGFDLTGDADLIIAGYSLDASIRQVVTKDRQEITVSGDLDVAGLKVSVSGRAGVDYVNDVPFPSMALSGTGSFSVGAFNLGSASFTLVESYSATGFSASVSVNLGALKGDTTISFLLQNDGAIRYKLGGSGKLSIGSNTLNVDFRSSNCATWDSCGSSTSPWVSMKASFSLSGLSYSTDWFSMKSDLSFDYSIDTSDSVNATPKDLKGTFEYEYDAKLSSKSPYLWMEQDVSVTIYYRADQKWHKVGTYSSGITFDLDPFKISFTIKIDGFGSKTFTVS